MSLRVSNKTPSLILVFLALSPTALQAGWWEKAKSLLKSDEASQVASSLSSDEIAEAFKQALKIGSDRIVSQLGETGGFTADPAIHIPLPEKLHRVKSALDKIGMAGLVEDLELKINQAAERATPAAKELFQQAITELTFDDVMRIYKGPKDSATTYFKEQMSPGLMQQMRPIIDETMNSVGAIQTYRNVMGKYESLPFVPDVKADLTNHVLNGAIDGIFFYLAQEETAIRENPARQTTELLKKAFGRE